MKQDKYIYALGFFDGVHLGHQALLRECCQLAQKRNCKAGVVTFTTHPDSVVSGKMPCLLSTPEERRHLLRQFGAEQVVELPFDQEMKNLCWRDFIRMLRGEYGADGFVCGEDFRFGCQGEGNSEILRQYCKAAGLGCAVVPQQKIHGTVVSSTYIRTLVESGEMEQAAEFTGHPYSLTGGVIHGRGLGRTIGIPTANIAVAEGIVLPKKGVYACKAQTPFGEYMAVTNVGNRPTVAGQHITVEPWLLDFSDDLYGKTITVEFYKFLRTEKKFDSLDEMKREIEKNAVQTRKIFEK